MNLVFTLLSALVPLFLVIGVGYGLKRWTSIVPQHHVPTFNTLIVSVTLPATIVTALTKSPPITAEYARLPLAMAVTEAVLIGVTLLAGRLLRLRPPTLGMMLLTGMFGNTVFLGYPVAQTLLPHVFTGAVLVDQIGMMIPLVLCAPVIMERCGTRDSAPHSPGATPAPAATALRVRLLRLARSPLLIALATGLTFHYLRPFVPPPLHPLGALLLKTTGYLGQATTPLALLALGVSLRPRSAASSPMLLLPCALKLVACPLLMWSLCRALGLHGEMLQVGILQAGMPTAVTCSIFAAQAGMDEVEAVGVVFATTVLSIVTLPVMLALLH